MQSRGVARPKEARVLGKRSEGERGDEEGGEEESVEEYKRSVARSEHVCDRGSLGLGLCARKQDEWQFS